LLSSRWSRRFNPVILEKPIEKSSQGRIIFGFEFRCKRIVAGTATGSL
jgi:hypothetical protein